jgi:filamentous hemagglutinin family protein
MNKSCFTYLPKIFVLSNSLINCVLANPQGGSVVGGSAQITYPNSNTTTINQSTNKAIINWETFNIDKGQLTQFNQPGSSSIILNRVNGVNGASSILGSLKANGQVWIINPAGVIFGRGSQVNAAGLFATTSTISNDDFMNGNYRFQTNTQFPNAAIINRGKIEVQPGGLVVLVANRVSNQGLIRAQSGTVLLGGATAYTLDFDGDQLINFVIDKQNTSKTSASLANSGFIDVSPSATMLMKQGTAKALVGRSINMTGVNEANGVSVRGGVIVLSAGSGGIKISGKLNAKGGIVSARAEKVKVRQAKITTSSPDAGGLIQITANHKLTINDSILQANSNFSGGKITILGNHTIALSNSLVAANGLNQGGEVLIGGNARGSGPEYQAKQTNINSNSVIQANALQNGNGGKIVVWSDNTTSFKGSIEAKGGTAGGNGGWVEVSGLNHLGFNGSVNTSAPYGKLGSLLLDPKFLIIQDTGVVYTGTNNTFADNPSGTTILTPASIIAVAADIILQANSDVIFNSVLALTAPGKSLIVYAGRSILVNSNVSTSNGNISMTANYSGSSPAVISPQRSTIATGNPSGDTQTVNGNITIASNAIVNAGSGDINLSIDPTATTPFTPGILTLNSGSRLLSSGSIRLTANGFSVNTLAQIGGTGAGTGSSANIAIQNATPGTNIGIFGAAGTMQLPTTMINVMRSNNLQIGGPTAGNIIIGGGGPSTTALTPNGNLTLQTPGTVTQSGSALLLSNRRLIIRDALSVTLNVFSNTLSQLAASNITGNFLLNYASNLAISSLADPLGTVSGLSIGGNLNLTGITSVVLSQTAPVNIAGTTTFNAPAQANTINLSNTSNSFIGAVSVVISGSGGSTSPMVSLVNAGALIIGSIALNSINQSNLVLTTVDGSIKQTGAITNNNGASALLVTAGNSHDIILTNTSNQWGNSLSAPDASGPINFNTSGSVEFVNSRNTVIENSTIHGDLTITQLGTTSIGQPTTLGANRGIISVSGNATFNAPSGVISLNKTNNFSGKISLYNPFNTDLTSVVLRNALPTVLGTSQIGSGAVTLTSGGSVTQMGSFTQVPTTSAAGMFTINAPSNADILLNFSGNKFNTLVLNGDIRDVSILNTGGNHLPSNDDGLQGTFEVNSNPNLRNVTLDYTTRGMQLASFPLKNGGNYIVHAGGDISKLSALNVPGLISFTSEGNLIINNATAANGAIFMRSNGNITLNSAATLTSGNNIILVNGQSTGNAFVNNNTSSSIITPGAGGRFLIYSIMPQNNIYRSLSPNFEQYSTVYPGTILGTGNGFIYSVDSPGGGPLSASLVNIAKAYDSTNTAFLSSSNYQLVGNVPAGYTTTITGAGGTYASPNVGINIPVTATGLTLTITGPNNIPVYGVSLTSSTVSKPVGTITPASLAIRSNASQGKVYGQSDPLSAQNAYTILSGQLYGSDSFSMGRAGGENAGTYNFTAHLADGNNGNNYNLTFNGSSNPFLILKAPLSSSIANQTKVYGTNDPSLSGISASITGAINNPSVSDINGNSITINDTGPSALAAELSGLIRIQNENVGTWAITGGAYNLTGTSAANYQQPTFTGSPTLSINPANLSFTINNQSKVYGANDPSLNSIPVGLTGAINHSVVDWNGDTTLINDTNSSALSAGLLGLSRAQGENVGSYTITGASSNLSGTSAGNYQQPTLTGSPTLSITPANLSFIINNQSKVYGANDPSLNSISVGLTGAINHSVVDWNGDTTLINDTNSSALSAGLLGLTRAQGEHVGNYTITGASSNLSGTSAGNYQQPILSGAPVLSITPADLILNLNNQSKLYGQNDPTLSAISLNKNGLINRNVATWYGNVLINDTQPGALNANLTSLIRQRGENVGAYSINSGSYTLSGTSALNYSGSPLNLANISLNILPTNLAIQANSQLVTTNETAPVSLTYSVNGLIRNSAVTNWMGEQNIISDSMSGDLGVVIGSVLYSSPVTTLGKNSGNYSIVQNNLSAGSNYVTQYTGGVLSIENAPPVPVPNPSQASNGPSHLVTQAVPEIFSSLSFVPQTFEPSVSYRFISVDHQTLALSGGLILVDKGTFPPAEANTVIANLSLNKKTFSVKTQTNTATNEIYVSQSPLRSNAGGGCSESLQFLSQSIALDCALLSN